MSQEQQPNIPNVPTLETLINDYAQCSIQISSFLQSINKVQEQQAGIVMMLANYIRTMNQPKNRQQRRKEDRKKKKARK